MLEARVFRRQIRATVAQLRQVRVVENREKLVDVRKGRSELLVNRHVDCRLQIFTGKTLFARKEVVRRLHLANLRIGELIQGAKLLVWTAYRHPYHVTAQYVETLAHVRESDSSLTYQQAEELINPFRAVPDTAPHPTGAAVDVTVVINGKDGKLRPPKDDKEALARRTLFHPFSTDVSLRVRTQRLFLRRAMMEMGFAPTKEEWWHFSYGDSEWALFWKKSHAIYGPVTFIV